MKIEIVRTGSRVRRTISIEENYDKVEYSDGIVVYWCLIDYVWYKHRLDGPAFYSLKGEYIDEYWVEGNVYDNIDEYNEAVTKFKQKENAESNSIHGINL